MVTQHLTNPVVTSQISDEEKIPLMNQIRSLGVLLNSVFLLKTQVGTMARPAFYHQPLTRNYLLTWRSNTLLHATVTVRLDYDDFIHMGLPLKSSWKLQPVQHVGARLLTDASLYDHIVPILCQLHWLPAVFWDQFRVLVITVIWVENHICNGPPLPIWSPVPTKDIWYCPSKVGNCQSSPGWVYLKKTILYSGILFLSPCIVMTSLHKFRKGCKAELFWQAFKGMALLFHHLCGMHFYMLIFMLLLGFIVCSHFMKHSIILLFLFRAWFWVSLERRMTYKWRINRFVELALDNYWGAENISVVQLATWENLLQHLVN